jgi:ABC-type dipeptide/oligopeptide/nickel transport system permease subunit
VPEPEIHPSLESPPARRNPLTRSAAGVIGVVVLAIIGGACLLTMPWTIGGERYNDQRQAEARVPPFWTYPDGDSGETHAEDIRRFNELAPPDVVARVAGEHGITADAATAATSGPVSAELREHWPRYWLGTDKLGRSLLVRCLAGGGISLGIGLAAAAISVLIGTLYGAVSAYAGGKTDAVMMRIVDVLYGLPYVLLVVLIAVASDAFVDEYVSRSRARQHWLDAAALRVYRVERGQEPTAADRDAFMSSSAYGHAEIAMIALEQAKARWRDDPRGPEPTLDTVLSRFADIPVAADALTPSTRDALEFMAAREYPPRNISAGGRRALDVVTLLVAIGGVSWLTMARVIRGQVLSLKAQPFMEAARAIGVPWRRQFTRHLLPNLVGPIIVYATLTVPQAILQESFLSFLGIGVKPPLPSWGTLAAEGLGELNRYKSHWWLLVFPCVLLGTTLLALNFVGEGLREALDPKRGRR